MDSIWPTSGGGYSRRKFRLHKNTRYACRLMGEIIEKQIEGKSRFGYPFARFGIFNQGGGYIRAWGRMWLRGIPGFIGVP